MGLRPIYKSIKEGNEWAKIKSYATYKRNNIEHKQKFMTCLDSDEDEDSYKKKKI